MWETTVLQFIAISQISMIPQLSAKGMIDFITCAEQSGVYLATPYCSLLHTLRVALYCIQDAVKALGRQAMQYAFKHTEISSFLIIMQYYSN